MQVPIFFSYSILYNNQPGGNHITIYITLNIQQSTMANQSNITIYIRLEKKWWHDTCVVEYKCLSRVESMCLYI